MEIYRVSLIGHRVIYESKCYNKIEEAVRELVYNHEFVEFYMGRSGDFDILAASAVKCVQKELGAERCALNLILPYRSRDEDAYAEFYDSVDIPLAKCHPKAAITLRNEWMAEHSDLIVAYVKEEHGGAYTMLKYAKKKGIEIINIAEEKEKKED